MDRDRKDSNFSRARSQFEGPRKRKTSYHEDRGRDEGRDYRDDRGSRRRSRSPPRWERGKKQKQKTLTDVPPERELFVGNIPSNIDDRMLLNFLNGAMRHASLCPRNEAPCLSCQINSGNFAFVEMLNADMANRCLNLNGILFLNARVKVGRPKKYTGPFVVTKTWQELMGESLTIDAVLDSEKEKVNRELFVGNTTPEMTDQMLRDFLGAAMEQVGLNIMDGNPITLCELFGKYAFIELRTPREATNALNLNNIPFMGSNLEITRPSKWQGTFEQHSNWEHILARFNMKPEDFQLGQILNPAVIKATPNVEPVEGESIAAVKAELGQVKKALDITRNQLEEANKKSEARKEQLVSLNKKWSEGKNELSERKNELVKAKEDMVKSKEVTMDVDSRYEAQELKRKHEETQGMLRGVTESLVKATEKLQTERKTRKNLELQLSRSSGFVLQMEPDEEAMEAEKEKPSGADEIDFASLRAELGVKEAPTTPAASTPAVQTPKTEAADKSEDHDMEDHEDEPKLESLKDFLNKTPKTNIDWTANATPVSAASPATTTPRSRDRGGVRLCRLLIHCPDMSDQDATDVMAMAGKYNLGGYIIIGKPGFIVVEGLEFNCDIFMDNMERQKTKYVNAGKVSERSGRAFPMELTKLEGGAAPTDFAKACDSVGLKDKLEAAASG